MYFFAMNPAIVPEEFKQIHGTYSFNPRMKYSCKIIGISVSGNLVLEFEEQPGNYAWQHKEGHEIKGVTNLIIDKWYWVIAPSDKDFIADSKENTKHGFHCIECNNYNQYAEANLTGGRFICFSCKASYSWRYEGQFL